MTAIADVREALATNLRTITKVENVSAYALDMIVAPCLEVDLDPEGSDYDLTFGRGTDELRLVVRGFTAAVVTQAAQMTRDAWLAPSGEKSVKAAVESDETLGGLVDTLRVESWRPIIVRSETIPNSAFVGAEWRIFVMYTP